MALRQCGALPCPSVGAQHPFEIPKICQKICSNINDIADILRVESVNKAFRDAAWVGLTVLSFEFCSEGKIVFCGQQISVAKLIEFLPIIYRKSTSVDTLVFNNEEDEERETLEKIHAELWKADREFPRKITHVDFGDIDSGSAAVPLLLREWKTSLNSLSIFCDYTKRSQGSSGRQMSRNGVGSAGRHVIGSCVNLTSLCLRFFSPESFHGLEEEGASRMFGSLTRLRRLNLDMQYYQFGKEEDKRRREEFLLDVLTELDRSVLTSEFHLMVPQLCMLNSMHENVINIVTEITVAKGLGDMQKDFQSFFSSFPNLTSCSLSLPSGRVLFGETVGDFMSEFIKAFAERSGNQQCSLNVYYPRAQGEFVQAVFDSVFQKTGVIGSINFDQSVERDGKDGSKVVSLWFHLQERSDIFLWQVIDHVESVRFGKGKALCILGLR